ncbi:hypothetical protein BD324DRAFT_387343 [Kockovaella imperatae]|uniref:Uncharacterized protein n=1 Tax=Kockovaella imperatae TaxID=4999 RepID=A0A1Y1UJ80_9TREE|nr:hypothetical protein BD324DRAFT_387343 [Kockovaella imperatae]ORX37607.1 hypothetical protein BD324DRAFT_387343 [Kockovaella imperatae]
MRRATKRRPFELSKTRQHQCRSYPPRTMSMLGPALTTSIQKGTRQTFPVFLSIPQILPALIVPVVKLRMSDETYFASVPPVWDLSAPIFCLSTPRDSRHQGGEAERILSSTRRDWMQYVQVIVATTQNQSSYRDHSSSVGASGRKAADAVLDFGWSTCPWHSLSLPSSLPRRFSSLPRLHRHCHRSRRLANSKNKPRRFNSRFMDPFQRTTFVHGRVSLSPWPSIQLGLWIPKLQLNPEGKASFLAS